MMTVYHYQFAFHMTQDSDEATGMFNLGLNEVILF